MVYSLENVRFLRQEHARLTEQARQIRESLAELKRQAGLDPDTMLPRQEAEPSPAESASSSPFSPGFFSSRFTV